MFKNPLLKWLFAPIFGLSIVEGGGGGGSDEDRGDFIPGDEDKGDDDAKAAAEAEAKKAAEDEAAKKAAEEAEAKAAAEAEAKKTAAKDDEKEDEDDKEDKKSKKDTRIPLSRHKEMLEKERAQREALEAELSKYKGGDKVAKTNEEITLSENKVVELDAKYAKFIADGDLEKAAATMREIRGLERDIADRKADMKAEEAEARAVERVRFDTIVDRIEDSYPEMNPKSEEYDVNKVAEVLEMKDAFQLKGYAPSAALQKAVKYILGAETKKQATATTADPKLDAKEVEKAKEEEDAKAAKAAARKEEQTKKNIDTATKQPPSTAKVGMDSDKAGGGILDAKAVMKMSQQDFAKLDEKQLAVLRGDEIAAN